LSIVKLPFVRVVAHDLTFRRWATAVNVKLMLPPRQSRGSPGYARSARDEWILTNIRCADVSETCLCGHFPINNICVLTNRRNAVTVEVGDECVKRFKGINLDLVFRRTASDQGRRRLGTQPRRDGILLFDGADHWLQRRFSLATWLKRSRLSYWQNLWRKQINRRVLASTSRSRSPASSFWTGLVRRIPGQPRR
jgi:hypothetical protein